MSIEEMKKELTIDPKETNGNNEMCLYSCQKRYKYSKTKITDAEEIVNSRMIDTFFKCKRFNGRSHFWTELISLRRPLYQTMGKFFKIF